MRQNHKAECTKNEENGLFYVSQDAKNWLLVKKWTLCAY
jgi:hypothetical protein